MSMAFILASMATMLLGGIAALVLGKSAKAASLAGVGGAVLGSALGLIGAGRVLYFGQDVLLRQNWSIPYGAFCLKADALSAFFLLPIFVLSGLAAIYGFEYLRPYQKEKSLGPPWFCFNLLLANMVLVVLAANGMLFLMAWELMSLSSYFLVTFEHEQPQVRRAGWIYLVAAHAGVVALFLMFGLFSRASGSMDFSTFGSGEMNATLLFLLALIGFGTKAGIMPLHFWLPEAHPVAPSHVSAVMSGVMIKTGIYGILRMLTFIGPPQPWWGWLLIVIGMSSGVLGIVLSLAQKDLKRLLAYSSVENIGIVMMGLGLGVLGLSYQSALLATLGFAGALLHILNHAVFKGLLFMCAGSVLHAVKTLNIDSLGGLFKRMPVTGFCFFIGMLAICGLPPFNGFAGEMLIYLAAFHGMAMPTAGGIAIGVIGALALIGGLAAAGFTKAFGITFLGEPRSDLGCAAHEPGWSMRAPLCVLAAFCLLLGFLAPVIVLRLLHAPVAILCGTMPEVNIQGVLVSASHSLVWFIGCGAGLLLLIGMLAMLRRRLLAQREVSVSSTWGCGYAQPSARMQYTAASFVQPIADFFHAVVKTQPKNCAEVDGLFPVQSREVLGVKSRTVPSFWLLFERVESFMLRLQRLQTGSIHLCILYIAITLIVLLIWKLK